MAILVIQSFKFGDTKLGRFLAKSEQILKEILGYILKWNTAIGQNWAYLYKINFSINDLFEKSYYIARNVLFIKDCLKK